MQEPFGYPTIVKNKKVLKKCFTQKQKYYPYPLRVVPVVVQQQVPPPVNPVVVPREVVVCR